MRAVETLENIIHDKKEFYIEFIRNHVLDELPKFKKYSKICQAVYLGSNIAVFLIPIPYWFISYPANTPVSISECETLYSSRTIL